MSLASMATSVPVPIARPRSAWASAAASLTPSPTIATTRPSRLQPADHVDLVLRAAPRRSPRRCRPARRPRAAARSLSPVSSTGRRPSSRSPATASAEVGLTVSATTSTARAAPSQPTKIGVRPAASAASRRCGEGVVEVQRPVGEEPLAPGDDGVAVDDALHAEPCGVGERLDRRAGVMPRARAPAAMACAIGCSDASSSDTGEAQHLVGVVLAGDGDDVDERHLRRWSPCRSCRARSCRPRRVDSRTSGPLMRTPSWAPRPVPTISAVGVARPSAHGQAMISTATAAVNAVAVPSVAAAVSQKPSVAAASAITTGTKTAEIRSASRCTSALPVWASSTSRPIWASAVSAPTRVARTTSRPPAFTVAPVTASPGADLDRAPARR